MSTDALPFRPDTVIDSDQDLFQLWASLMGPGGFGRRSLWVVFLTREGTLSPVVMPIDHVPVRPDRPMIRNLQIGLTEVLAEADAASYALLLSRPGVEHMTDQDRAWARELSPISPWWPIHLATKDRVQVFAPDDLVLAPRVRG